MRQREREIKREKGEREGERGRKKERERKKERKKEKENIIKNNDEKDWEGENPPQKIKHIETRYRKM